MTYISLILCFLLTTNTVAFAVEIQPQAAVDSIKIENRSGILLGETIQLTAAIESNGSFLSGVEWSSNNPEVISCTKDGKIKGITAGKSAVITCKAKWGSAEDTITICCAERIPQKTKSAFKYMLTFVFSGTSILPKDICFDMQAFLGILSPVFKYLQTIAAKTSSDVFLGSKVTVYGRLKSMAYIRYGENEKLDGFVRYMDLKNTVNGFLNLSAKDMDVWANGITYTNRKLTASYKGNIDWSVENNNYISFDKATGQIVGQTAGVGKAVKITAKADGMSEECTVHLLYKWEQPWTSKTNKGTYLYRSEGTEYISDYYLSKGKEFVVQGDCGTDSGWAYGYCKIDGKEKWGYVPIADVSTKNTVSYYNSLNWVWPLQNKNYNYINSPYSPRPAYNDLHRGFDINEKEDQADIEGKALVAPFDGVVRRVGADLDPEKGCGYYICVTSNTVDPVTGKNLIAIYQHMNGWALFSQDEHVKKGDVIGYAGDTGRSGGSHLHFEVNNWNAGIGDSGRSDFTYTINPIYFYMDMVKNNELVFNMGCSSVSSGYSFYFYNYDK